MRTDQKAKLTIQSAEPRVWDQTFRLMSWWDADKIAQAKVMVVGAGALGNEVLKNLALLNVGHILIVDFDTIEYANLCRSILFREADCGRPKADVAADRIREINPNIKVQVIKGDIMIDVGLGVFRQMDVIIGCLDNRLARLFINRYCHKTNKTWVDGAIENLAGQLDVFKPGVSCYECQLEKVERDIIRYRLGCADVARRNTEGGRVPTTPISSSIIAAMQVQEAMKVIFQNDKQSMAGTHFKYEGMNNVILQYANTTRLESCESHETIDQLIEAKELSADNTVADVLAWAEKQFGDSEAIIHLGYDVVYEITTKESEEVYPVLMALPHLSDKLALRYQKVPGEDLILSTIEHGISKKKLQDLSVPLRQIGVAPLQILKIEAASAYHYVELSGDADFINFQ